MILERSMQQEQKVSASMTDDKTGEVSIGVLLKSSPEIVLLKIRELAKELGLLSAGIKIESARSKIKETWLGSLSEDDLTHLAMHTKVMAKAANDPSIGFMSAVLELPPPDLPEIQDPSVDNYPLVQAWQELINFPTQERNEDLQQTIELLEWAIPLCYKAWTKKDLASIDDFQESASRAIFKDTHSAFEDMFAAHAYELYGEADDKEKYQELFRDFLNTFERNFIDLKTLVLDYSGEPWNEQVQKCDSRKKATVIYKKLDNLVTLLSVIEQQNALKPRLKSYLMAIACGVETKAFEGFCERLSESEEKTMTPEIRECLEHIKNAASYIEELKSGLNRLNKVNLREETTRLFNIDKKILNDYRAACVYGLEQLRSGNQIEVLPAEPPLVKFLEENSHHLFRIEEHVAKIKGIAGSSLGFNFNQIEFDLQNLPYLDELTQRIADNLAIINEFGDSMPKLESCENLEELDKVVVEAASKVTAQSLDFAKNEVSKARDALIAAGMSEQEIIMDSKQDLKSLRVLAGKLADQLEGFNKEKILYTERVNELTSIGYAREKVPELVTGQTISSIRESANQLHGLRVAFQNQKSLIKEINAMSEGYFADEVQALKSQAHQYRDHCMQDSEFKEFRSKAESLSRKIEQQKMSDIRTDLINRMENATRTDVSKSVLADAKVEIKDSIESSLTEELIDKIRTAIVRLNIVSSLIPSDMSKEQQLAAKSELRNVVWDENFSRESCQEIILKAMLESSLAQIQLPTDDSQAKKQVLALLSSSQTVQTFSNSHLQQKRIQEDIENRLVMVGLIDCEINRLQKKDEEKQTSDSSTKINDFKALKDNLLNSGADKKAATILSEWRTKDVRKHMVSSGGLFSKNRSKDFVTTMQQGLLAGNLVENAKHPNGIKNLHERFYHGKNAPKIESGKGLT
jgi:hypothetical protein